jgi:antitoxin component of MazEF toxin-antitoxin module
MNKIVAFTIFAPLAAIAADNVTPVVVFGQFADPNEGAFTVNVPRDWKVSGGASRRAAVDIRQVVHATSPDGNIEIFLDDPNIVPRQVPNAMMQQMGLREGQTIQGAWGGPVLLQRYRAGTEYARDYAGLKVCQAQFTGGGELAQETAEIRRQANALAQTIPSMMVRASAGDAYFKCGEALGYVQATTVEASMQGGVAVWAVLQMGGFKVKRAEDAPLAMYILHNMVASFHIDPQWQARNDRDQQALTAAVTRMQNNMMANLAQQSAARASSERSSVVGHPNNIDVMSGWEARNKSHDAVMQRGSDARRGTTVTSDPVYGSRTVSNDSNYYWTRPDGSIIGTNTDTVPQVGGGGWRMMSKGN